MIKPTQTAFMPGRHMLEEVVILHETIHELRMKKMDIVLFKIGFKNRMIRLMVFPTTRLAYEGF
jgi:phosphate starvation-inducible protein PhoH